MRYLALGIVRFFMALGIVLILDYLLPDLASVRLSSAAYLVFGISIVSTAADIRRQVSPFIRGVTDFCISLLIFSATRWFPEGAKFGLWASFLTSFFIGLGGIFLPYRPAKSEDRGYIG